MDTAYPRIISTFWEYFDGYFFFKKIKEINFNPDIIIFLNASQSFYSSFKLRKAIPVVAFINDYEKILNGNQYPWYSRERYHRKKSRILESIATRYLYKIIVNSQFLSHAVSKTYTISSHKIVTLHKGVDLQKFKFNPVRPSYDTQTISVLFIKSDVIIGGLMDLIQALQLLPEYNFEVTVCGALIPKIRKRFKSKYNKVSVNYKGKTNQEEIVDLMYTNHILCVPSLREALGVANIEGLAAGIPVVTTNVGGIPEVMNSGANGYLAEPSKPKDLAVKILQCLKNSSERNQKSLCGRKWVEEYFDQNNIFDQFNQFIEEFVEEFKKIRR